MCTLPLQPGMAKLASRLETRRYLSTLNGTTEFAKWEGITFDPNFGASPLAGSGLHLCTGSTSRAMRAQMGLVSPAASCVAADTLRPSLAPVSADAFCARAGDLTRLWTPAR